MQKNNWSSANYCLLFFLINAPYRVPVARLAEAHTTLNNPEPKAVYRKKL
ncbi:MAG: hypothetical protein ACW99A_03815 [Candidatus Kariarchaeaceae archaeon]